MIFLNNLASKNTNRARVFLTIALVLVLNLLLLSITFAILQRYSQYDELEVNKKFVDNYYIEKTKRVAENLAYKLMQNAPINPKQLKDLHEIEDYLRINLDQKLKFEHSIDLADITSTDGSVIAKHGSITLPSAGNLKDSKNEENLPLININNELYWQVIAPLLAQNKVLGYFRVLFPNELVENHINSLTDQAEKQYRTQIFTFIIISLLSFLLSFFLAYFILRNKITAFPDSRKFIQDFRSNDVNITNIQSKYTERDGVTRVLGEMRDEIFRIRENLQRTRQFSRSLTEIHQADLILELAVEELTTFLSGNGRSAIFLEEIKKNYELVLLRGFSNEAAKMIPPEIHRFAGLIKRLTNERGSFVVTPEQLNILVEKESVNTYAEEIANRDYQIPSFGSKMLCLPIWESQSLMGLVLLQSRDSEYEIRDEDIIFSESICHNISLCLSNLKLLSQTKELARHEVELDLARGIQDALMPNKMPEIPGLSLDAHLESAWGLSGDYFDIISSEEKSESGVLQPVDYIIVGDASGKGTPASLIMVMVRTLFHILVRQKLSLKEIILEMNEYLHNHLSVGSFMTMIALKWNRNSKILEVVGAGHQHILFYRANLHQVIKLHAGGTYLGFMPNDEVTDLFELNKLLLEPGDIILLFTDGLLDAKNSSGDSYESERLMDYFKDHVKYTPQRIVKRIHADVRRFVGTASRVDDLTILALKRNVELSDLFNYPEQLSNSEINLLENIANDINVHNFRVAKILLNEALANDKKFQIDWKFLYILALVNYYLDDYETAAHYYEKAESYCGSTSTMPIFGYVASLINLDLLDEAVQKLESLPEHVKEQKYLKKWIEFIKQNSDTK